MKTTQSVTLESLNLKCSIASRGIGSIQNDERDMLAWNALFTDKRGVQVEFNYFTGSGCGPKPTPKELGDANAQCTSNRNKAHIDCLAALVAARRTRWTPDPIEILNCIARDGDSLEMTFEDWASEFGYDTDSRKAEKVYRACQDNALRLKKILSAEQIQSLCELDI